jgi:hypothetical protein
VSNTPGGPASLLPTNSAQPGGDTVISSLDNATGRAGLAVFVAGDRVGGGGD